MSHQFSGSFSIPGSREEAFELLSRPERFAPLLPSYVSHELRDDGSAAVKVKVGVGKVRGTGEVVLVLEDSVEPRSATYSGKGKVMGGVFNLNAGFELEEASPDTTRVNWKGDMAMFGKLVSLAGGLIKPIAERDINELIQALQIALGGEVSAPEPAAPKAAPAGEGWWQRFMAWLKSLFGKQ